MTLTTREADDNSERLRAALNDGGPDESTASLDDFVSLVGALLEASAVVLMQLDGTTSLWRARSESLPAVRILDTVRQHAAPSQDGAGPVVTSEYPAVAEDPASQRDVISLVVPSSEGEPLGTISVLDHRGKSWTEQQIAVMPSVAKLAGREILRQRAIGLTRLANAKLSLLADVSHQLAGSLDVEDSVGKLAHLVVPLLGDWCVISVIDEDGQLRDVGWWHETQAGRELVAAFVSERLLGLNTNSPTMTALHDRRSTTIDSGALEAGLATLTSPLARDIWRRLSPGSYGVFPMTAGSTVTGVLAIMRHADRPPMSRIAHEVAAAIAERAGVALENARLFANQRVIAEQLSVANGRILATARHDRVVARALQDALLPRVASTDDLEISSRYRTADGEDQVGGDFYDAIDNQTAGTTLVIGDVSGHDITAAAVMGRIINMLRAFVWDRPDESPAELLERVDHAMAALGVKRMATAALIHLERPVGELGDAGRRVEWANAGHLPPLVVKPDGVVNLLGLTPDCPLGINYRAERRYYESWLPIGSTLLLYTDGLVETRERDLDAGIAQLRAYVSAHTQLQLDDLLDGLLAEMVPQEPHDDVAIVGIRLLA